ncbi:hypothetical protein D3C80_853480 [compost metagenome]
MLAHRGGECLQQFVARLVTMAVVDALEVVQIQHADREGAFPPFQLLRHLFGTGPEASPIEDAGEMIVVRQVFHPAQQVIACRHYAGGGERGEGNQHDADPHREHPVLSLDILTDGQVAVGEGEQDQGAEGEREQAGGKDGVVDGAPEQGRDRKGNGARPLDQQGQQQGANHAKQGQQPAPGDIRLIQEAAPIRQCAWRGQGQDHRQYGHVVDQLAGEPEAEPVEV